MMMQCYLHLLEPPLVAHTFSKMFRASAAPVSKKCVSSVVPDSSEVKQSQIYDARLCTSNHEKKFQTKNKLPN